MRKFNVKLFQTGLFFFLFGTVAISFASDKQSAVVLEVLTGDSVRLEGGKILKYANVSSPPLQSAIPMLRQYGLDALLFNKKLVAGKKILVEWGPQIRDEKNNLLGYVFLEDGTFVNEALLKEGHGKLALKAPNLKYSDVFRRSELEAQRNKKGLWKEEPVNPYIKNEYVGEKNTKIYYFPTSPELEHIPQAYLVNFKSRVEAVAAGYRPCSTCHENETQEF